MSRPLDSSRIRLVETTTEHVLPERMLTTSEVCKLLQCSEGLVRKLRRSGQLPEVRLSHRKILYRLRDIEDLIGTR